MLNIKDIYAFDFNFKKYLLYSYIKYRRFRSGQRRSILSIHIIYNMDRLPYYYSNRMIITVHMPAITLSSRNACWDHQKDPFGMFLL